MIWRLDLRIVMTIAILSLFCVQAHAGGPTLCAEGSKIRADFDAENGDIKSITNIFTGRKTALREDSFSIVTDKGTISSDDCKVAMSGSSSVTRDVSAHGLKVVQKTVFHPDKGYFDRTITLENVGDGPVVVEKIVGPAFKFEKSFEDLLLHTDNMKCMDPGTESLYEMDEPAPYQTTLNVFARDEDGGYAIGIKYPYFTSDLASDSITLGYETNYRLLPTQTLELPASFVAAYKNTGYTCRKELHWEPRILETEQHEMDWGEVYAMQEVVTDFLPEYRLGEEDEYYLWLNSWWADSSLHGAIDEKTYDKWLGLIDQVSKVEALDAMVIAPVWLGWSGFIVECPKLDAIGADAEFPTNDYIDGVMKHADKKNVPIFGFCEPEALARRYRLDRPDWDLMPEADSEKTLDQKCCANPDYEEWFFRLTCSAVDKYDLAGWAYDHMWVRRPMVCHSECHGHEPGNCEFAQYKNVTKVVLDLRERYPDKLLEIYWGLKEAGTWGHKGLNSLENLYENCSPPPPDMTCADDQRFQHWYNHNYRFFPTYVNLAQINFKKEKNGETYSILSSLSASTHGSLTDWKQIETQEEADAAFENLANWKKWANENAKYLHDRVDIFGQPCRMDGIDGTAHIVDGDGWIFVFNPWPKEHWGSIVLDAMIGISNENNLELSTYYPEKGKADGIYEYGDEFVFAINGKSAMLIEVRKTDKDAKHWDVPENAQPQPSFSR